MKTTILTKDRNDPHALLKMSGNDSGRSPIFQTMQRRSTILVDLVTECTNLNISLSAIECVTCIKDYGLTL